VLGRKPSKALPHMALEVIFQNEVFEETDNPAADFSKSTEMAPKPSKLRSIKLASKPC